MKRYFKIIPATISPSWFLDLHVGSEERLNLTFEHRGLTWLASTLAEAV
jgi:hypothetical protein